MGLIASGGSKLDVAFSTFPTMPFCASLLFGSMHDTSPLGMTTVRVGASESFIPEARLGHPARWNFAWEELLDLGS
jgi:hypothetical protein